MPKVAFEYRDFWEVPRLIVCTVNDTELLLDSAFDEATGRYAPTYRVYALPPELNLDSADSLTAGPDSASPEAVYLGSIPVSEIEFDETNRKEIEVNPLLKLLAC